MTAELDALLIRSLPELNDAANRLHALDGEIGRAVDREVAEWALDKGWRHQTEFHGKGKTWVAPAEWMMPNTREDAYMKFRVEVTGGDPSSYWYVVGYAASTAERIGFWLYSDAFSYSALKRLFKASDLAADLPMHESEFFVPLRLDRETLAQAVENGRAADAMQPIRDALDRLPALAEQLQPLKQAVVTAAAK